MRHEGSRWLAAASVVVAALFVGAVGGGAAAQPHQPSAELAILLAKLDAAVPVEQAQVGDTIDDRLIVTWHEDASVWDVADALDRMGIDGRPSPGSRVQVLDVRADQLKDVAASLAGSPLVEVVAADMFLSFRTATDPDVPRQWGLENLGQAVPRFDAPGTQAGVPGVDVGALDAWRQTRGSRAVTVAVIDTGTAISHPDLQPNLWINPGEKAGTGNDDDGNGYADDVHGWNFVANTPDVEDDEGHGTHVAGTVAAAVNGVGTAGVAPRVRLMTVKFLDAAGNGRTSDAVKAVRYAADNGAHVINASWGVEEPGSLLERMALAQLEIAIEDARVPFVAAAGNHSADVTEDPFYPAAFEAPNIISVTAVDNLGRRPDFAAYSSTAVDVAAPGVSVYSTTLDADHGYLSGTSMAVPHVTGIVALAVSLSGDTDGARLARAVRRTTRPFGSLKDTTRSSGATIAGLASGPGLLTHYGADLGACRGGAPIAPFTDVSRSNVHAKNIDCAVHRRLARGFTDGTYRPHTAVTRAQVATFLAGLYRTAAELSVPTKGQFSDVSTNNVHRDNIEALAAVGIIGGFPDGTFKPSRPVTREQFASLLVRTYQHLARGEVRGRSVAFPDGGSAAHRDNVRLAAYLGFVQGKTDGSFGPRDNVTRAQLASLIRRALDKLVLDRVSHVD